MPDVPAGVLLHVEHGSRLARGWLAALAAADTDPERPALWRVVLLELFATGVRITATDSYWLASAWVGEPVDPGEPFGALHAPPELDELPARGSVPVVDPEFRIRDLMRFVARRTKEVDAEHPEIPLTLTVTRERSDDVPTLDPSFDRDRVDVAIPAIERVSGYVNEVEYPNVARLLHSWRPQPGERVVDRVQVSPKLLRSLAAAVSAVQSDGVLFTLGRSAKAPIGWHVVEPAAAVLGGLLMPQTQLGTPGGES